MSRWITIEAAELAVKALEEENAHLKAKVKSIRKYWKATSEGVNMYVGKSIALEDEVARLKADVERLKAKQTDIDRVQAQSDFYRSKLINGTEYTANVQLIDQVKHLEAQVERLTKAGDAFYESEIGYYGEQILNDPKHNTGRMCRDWNDAKEGKQS